MKDNSLDPNGVPASVQMEAVADAAIELQGAMADALRLIGTLAEHAVNATDAVRRLEDAQTGLGGKVIPFTTKSKQERHNGTQ